MDSLEKNTKANSPALQKQRASGESRCPSKPEWGKRVQCRTNYFLIWSAGPFETWATAIGSIDRRRELSSLPYTSHWLRRQIRAIAASPLRLTCHQFTYKKYEEKRLKQVMTLMSDEDQWVTMITFPNICHTNKGREMPFYKY